VIPQVIGPVVARRTGKEKPFELPTKCPVCGAAVIKPEGEAMARCTGGSRCPAQRYELVKHFVSRGAMDIDGMGEKLVAAMIQGGLITDVADIYRVSKEDLLQLERLAEKSAQNLIDAIETSKSRPLPRLLVALGIRYVGEQTAELLASHFGSLGALMNASQEEIEDVEGIGPKIAEAVFAYFQEPANREVIEKLRAAGLRFEAERTEPSDSALAGRSFVVTGTLEHHSRLQIEARIRDLGGNVTDNVSRKTDYLLVGAEPGSKVRRAQQIGTRIIDEAEFEKLAAGESID